MFGNIREKYNRFLERLFLPVKIRMQYFQGFEGWKMERVFFT
jgi:hypothetical protein